VVIPIIEAPGPDASQDTLIAHLRWARMRRAGQSHETMERTCFWCRSDEAPSIARERGFERIFCSSRCLEAYQVAVRAQEAASRA
jgi:hypothetical protein